MAREPSVQTATSHPTTTQGTPWLLITEMLDDPMYKHVCRPVEIKLSNLTMKLLLLNVHYQIHRILKLSNFILLLLLLLFLNLSLAVEGIETK